MDEFDIERVRNPGHIVAANASFEEVVQHTYWFLMDDHNPNPHYRYERYSELREGMGPSGRREAHVDIGCGAGLFSWVFLDWAKKNGVAYENIDLYGLDHCPEMINLARLVKDYLLQEDLLSDLADYPELHYTHDVSVLLNELTDNHCPGTDYTITFGHVLVQAQSRREIRTFARVIFHILRLLDVESKCLLIAADAQNRSSEFEISWGLLMDNLTQPTIGHRLHPVKKTQINDDRRARIAELYTVRRSFA